MIFLGSYFFTQVYFIPWFYLSAIRFSSSRLVVSDLKDRNRGLKQVSLCLLMIAMFVPTTSISPQETAQCFTFNACSLKLKSVWMFKSM